MQLQHRYVLLFFAVVAAVAVVLFPTKLDLVLLFRNSYRCPYPIDRAGQTAWRTL